MQYSKNKNFNKKRNCLRSLLMHFSQDGSATVRNSNHFVDELIEIGGFSKILD